jgi:hypothetical protein
MTLDLAVPHDATSIPAVAGTDRTIDANGKQAKRAGKATTLDD